MLTAILILAFTVVYVLGALLTLKMDAMWCNRETDWCEWWCALIAWVPISIIMLRTKHAVHDCIDWSKTDYRY